MVVVFSTKIYEIKKNSFYRIKLKSVSNSIKKIDRIENDSKLPQKNSNKNCTA
jgi:hypothetical protein